MSNDSISSVLVYVGLDRVGDSLLKLPFVRELRACYPNARVTWLAGKETTAYSNVMAGQVDGLIDEIIEYGGVAERPSEVFHKTLPDRHFDLIIDTQKNIWTSLALKRIRHKTFISPAMRFWLSNRKPSRTYEFPENMQRQLLDLLELASGNTIATPSLIPLEIPAAHRERASTLLPDGAVYCGFAPGSGGRPKCWPLERFIDWAKIQVGKGRIPVALIGPQEPEWIETIQTAVPQTLFPLQAEGYEHGFDPLFTIALAERLQVSLSNDSGVGHMLAISGTSLVSLFGPTLPEKFTPMGKRVSIIRAEDFGGWEMENIPLEKVLQETEAMFGEA